MKICLHVAPWLHVYYDAELNNATNPQDIYLLCGCCGNPRACVYLCSICRSIEPRHLIF